MLDLFWRAHYGKYWKEAKTISATGRRVPWYIAYHGIKDRCGKPGHARFKSYGGRGIKCMITMEQLAMTYYRDKAHLLKQASVDRINPDDHYRIGNIRWIEKLENSNRARRRRAAVKS